DRHTEQMSVRQPQPGQGVVEPVRDVVGRTDRGVLHAQAGLPEQIDAVHGALSQQRRQISAVHRRGGVAAGQQHHRRARGSVEPVGPDGAERRGDIANLERRQRRHAAPVHLEEPVEGRRIAEMPDIAVRSDPDIGDSQIGRCHSTVTDLARLRGLSTSYPRACATDAANTCSGTVDNSGWKSVETTGISMRWSAYGRTVSSPSSAMTMVTAPRAWISRMLLNNLPCSVNACLGDG